MAGAKRRCFRGRRHDPGQPARRAPRPSCADHTGGRRLLRRLGGVAGDPALRLKPPQHSNSSDACFTVVSRLTSDLAQRSIVTNPPAGRPWPPRRRTASRRRGRNPQLERCGGRSTRLGWRRTVPEVVPAHRQATAASSLGPAQSASARPALADTSRPRPPRPPAETRASPPAVDGAVDALAARLNGSPRCR